MNNLIESTIEKIKKQHIAPQPKWKYLSRRYGMWIVFGLIVILGAASFSVAMHLLFSLDWDLYQFIHRSRVAYSLSIFPYFWAVLIGMFAVIAFFDIRKTETGYRFSLLKISLMTIGGIIVFGLALFLSGLGSRLNSMMTSGVPYYGQHLMVTKESQWSNPDGGFLSGKLAVISDDSLEIIDLSGQRWNILLDEKTIIKPAAIIKKEEMIKVIGIKKSADNFQAIEIRPWMGQGMMKGAGMGKGAGRGNGGGGMMRGN